MCTNSTSNPFFLKNPSSCATQVPLMLLAKEVHATRAFICAQAADENKTGKITTAMPRILLFIFLPIAARTFRRCKLAAQYHNFYRGVETSVRPLDVARMVAGAKNAKPEQFVDLRFLDRLEKKWAAWKLYK